MLSVNLSLFIVKKKKNQKIPKKKKKKQTLYFSRPISVVVRDCKLPTSPNP